MLVSLKFVPMRTASLRLVTLLLAACAAVLGLSAFVISANGAPPLIVAHRGASNDAPENTMAAFEQALRSGADYIELDVRFSKDRELVLMHDKMLDRTTGAVGEVHHYTLEELKKLDAGSWFGTAYAGEPIPTLREVLDRYLGEIGIMIEIKDPDEYPGIVEATARLLALYDAADDRVFVQSFDLDAVRLVHELLPGVPTAALINDKNGPLTEEKLDEIAVYADYFNVNMELLDRELVRSIHDRGRKAMAWTMHSRSDERRMRQLGVDGIITNLSPAVSILLFK